MPLFLLETGADGTDTISSVFSSLSEIFQFIVGLLGKVVTMITSTPLIFVPVLVAFGGGAILLAVSLVKRLGVGRGGKRRGR